MVEQATEQQRVAPAGRRVGLLLQGNNLAGDEYQRVGLLTADSGDRAPLIDTLLLFAAVALDRLDQRVRGVVEGAGLER